MISAFRDHLIKLAAQPRTPKKTQEGIANAGGVTSKYYNASLRKKKTPSTPKGVITTKETAQDYTVAANQNG